MIDKIGVVIPVFNGLPYLQRNLPGILGQIKDIKEWNYTVIVADDNSSDGTAEWLAEHYPQVVVLKGTGSLWWSGSTNLGVKYALADKSFRFILLWNHDIQCDDNYFSILAGQIQKYPGSMIASKIYFLHQPDVIFNMGAYFNAVTGGKRLNGYGMRDDGRFAEPVKVDWTGGMGTLIPAEIFRKVGLFDEKSFPQYYGDADFFLRAKSAGFMLIVLPELKIWNDKSSSGISHPGSLKMFYRSLTSMRSNSNLKIQYKFLKRHCRSVVWPFYFSGSIIRSTAGFLKNLIFNHRSYGQH